MEDHPTDKEEHFAFAVSWDYSVVRKIYNLAASNGCNLIYEGTGASGYELYAPVSQLEKLQALVKSLADQGWKVQLYDKTMSITNDPNGGRFTRILRQIGEIP